MQIKSIPILDIHNSFKEIGFEEDEFIMAMTELCFKWVNVQQEDVNLVTKDYLTNMLDISDAVANILFVNCGHKLLAVASLLKTLKDQGVLTNWFISPTSLLVEML